MEEYKQFAERIAREAGAIIKECFSREVECMYKDDCTIVTETDTRINSLLINEVTRLFPAHEVLGEEESNHTGGSEYLWVCDPLDGTKMFAHGIPLSTFSLALVHNGEVVLGVVYDPFSERLYSAEKGKGAFINGKQTYVSTQSTFKRAMADCEMTARGKYDLLPFVGELLNRETAFMKLGAFIYPSVLVAAGQFDFTVFPLTTVYDAAAVKIIVEEAGGKVTDIHGNEQRYDQPINGLLVSNGILHNELVTLTKKLVQLL